MLVINMIISYSSMPVCLYKSVILLGHPVYTEQVCYICIYRDAHVHVLYPLWTELHCSIKGKFMSR